MTPDATFTQFTSRILSLANGSYLLPQPHNTPAKKHFSLWGLHSLSSPIHESINFVQFGILPILEKPQQLLQRRTLTAPLAASRIAFSALRKLFTPRDTMEEAKKKFFMPCIWESDDFPDGSPIQVGTFHWTFLGVSGGDWAQLIEQYSGVPPASEAFVVIRVNEHGGRSFECPAPKTLWQSLESMVLTGALAQPSCKSYMPDGPIYVALKAPNGKLLAVDGDEKLSASLSPPEGERVMIPPQAVFKIDKPTNDRFTIWSMGARRFLNAWLNGGVKFCSDNPDEWEQFHIRHVALVPKFLGANLGGWLVAEQWMIPQSIYDGVFTDIRDGTTAKLKSWSEGKWTSAEGGGGDQIHSNRDSASAWETFFLRRTPGGGLQLRTWSGHYWSLDYGTLEVFANSDKGGSRETFGLRRKVGDESKFQLKACNGKWVRVEGGSLYADIDEDVPGWETNCTFEMEVVSTMGGEFQLCSALGPEEASRRLKEHRETFITEDDFRWMAAKGGNAVRIGVGYWIATDDNPPYPFIRGTLSYLDKAFNWAQGHNIRIVLCLHAAPGSQNGWEHSAARDGLPEWGKPGTGHLQQSKDVIEFLAARYGAHPMLAGIEPVNEPRCDAISFEALVQYYEDCYKIVRRHTASAYFLIEARIWTSEREWDNFMTGPQYTNVILDTHWYQVHDLGTFGGTSVEFNLQFPSKQRVEALKEIEQYPRLVVIGEWSLGLNCETSNDINTQFGKAQVERYGAACSGGFFFWSLKHGQGWDAWSFERSVELGWLKPDWWGGPQLLQLSKEAAAQGQRSDRSEL